MSRQARSVKARSNCAFCTRVARAWVTDSLRITASNARRVFSLVRLQSTWRVGDEVGNKCRARSTLKGLGL